MKDEDRLRIMELQRQVKILKEALTKIKSGIGKDAMIAKNALEKVWPR